MTYLDRNNVARTISRTIVTHHVRMSECLRTADAIIQAETGKRPEPTADTPVGLVLEERA